MILFNGLYLFYFEITYHYGRHELRNRMDIVSYNRMVCILLLCDVLY